jgi:hypothetical protein
MKISGIRIVLTLNNVRWNDDFIWRKNTQSKDEEKGKKEKRKNMIEGGGTRKHKREM